MKCGLAGDDSSSQSHSRYLCRIVDCTSPRHALLLVALVAAGCVAGAAGDDDPASGGKADGNGTCEDVKYGDGTCHIDLGCRIPDIDCFQTRDR